MDGRAGAVALNVRQMLSPPRESCAPKTQVVTKQADESNAKTVRDTPSSSPTPLARTPGSVRSNSGSSCGELISSKEHLRERLVIAEARVAAAASSNTRAAHMAAHLRDMLSPQATRGTGNT